jgi:hypothetical protein
LAEKFLDAQRSEREEVMKVLGGKEKEQEKKSDYDKLVAELKAYQPSEKQKLVDELRDYKSTEKKKIGVFSGK